MQNDEQAIDEWLGQLEGFSLRIERLDDDRNKPDGVRQWLVAAYRLGREAALAASPAEPVAWHRTARFTFHFSLARDRPKNSTSDPNEWAPLFASPAARAVAGWQTMDSAPLDGKHCILAVKSDVFIYSVQGAYDGSKWNSVIGSDVKPLAWMPNVLLPAELMPKAEGEQP